MKLPSEARGKVRAVLLIQLSYDSMRFLKKEDLFAAKYEFSVEILDGADSIVARKYWDKEFKLQNFEETLNKNEIFLEPLDFELKPGFYRYFAEMTDADSKKTFQKRDSKIFPPYWNDMVGFGDLVFSRGTGDKPFLEDVIPSEQEMEIDFNDGFTMNMQLFTSDNKPIEFSWKLMNFLDRTEVFLGDSITLEPSKNIIDIGIPVTGKTVPTGVYLLEGHIKNMSGKQSSLLQRIRIIWTNPPLTSFDIDESLEQMQYILTKAEIIRVQGMYEDEKKSFFEEFWKERDPTPNSQKNELMEEYFKRLQYANEMFSVRGRSGWKTDRGKIYCIYGKPDKRQPIKLSMQQAPMEQWEYLKAKKRFTFADYNRNGDYELVSEIDIKG